MRPWPASTRCQGCSCVTSQPSNRTRPARTRGPGCGSNPMTASEVMLFPQPDSPTRPRISPLAKPKDTPATMSTGSVSGPTDTVRSQTVSTALTLLTEDLTEPRIESIAQCIADQVQRKRRRHDHHAREEEQPRSARDEGPRFRQHIAPARNVRRGAEAQEVE